MRDKLFNDDIDIADFRFDDSVVKVFDDIGAFGFWTGDKRNGLFGFFEGKFVVIFFWALIFKTNDSMLFSIAEALKVPKIIKDSNIVIDCFTKWIN
mgnify:CR=1 FL=1